VNFATFFANTEPWMAAISTVEYGNPATEADLLRRLSPLNRVDHVTAPTLVLHGANDTNVPVVEAEQVVPRSSGAGVPVEYVLVLPDEGQRVAEDGQPGTLDRGDRPVVRALPHARESTAAAGASSLNRFRPLPDRRDRMRSCTGCAVLGCTPALFPPRYLLAVHNLRT
jgi:hypothetical protein